MAQALQIPSRSVELWDLSPGCILESPGEFLKPLLHSPSPIISRVSSELFKISSED